MAGYYRELCALLRAHGYQPLKGRGKGSHEIWHHPLKDRIVSVPFGTDKRHTVNRILKEAGIDRKL